MRCKVDAPARQDVRDILALFVGPAGRWLESRCSGGVILVFHILCMELVWSTMIVCNPESVTLQSSVVMVGAINAR